MNSVDESSQSLPHRVSIVRRLQWAIALLMPIVGFGVFGLQENSDILLLSLAILIFGIICIPILLKRTYYFVEPYTIIFWMLYLGVPAKIVWALHNRDTPQMHGFMLGMPIETLGLPTALTGLAITALVIGYMLGTKFKCRPVRAFHYASSWNTRSVFFVCGALVLVSFIAFGMYSRQAGINFSANEAISAKRIAEAEESGAGPMGRGSSLAYYRWAISLSQIAFYIVLAWTLKCTLRRSGIVTMLIVLSIPMAMAFLMPFVTSSRTPLIFFLVESLVILYCLKKDVLAGRWLVAQVVAATMVVFLFLAILALRRDPKAEESGLQELTPIALIDHVVGARYLADITKTAQIIRAFPEPIPFQYGASYTSAIAAPIPRSWWPGKPSLGLGPFIGENVYGLTRTGVPPGLFGEAYLNFGLLGIIFVPLIFGFLVRSSFESVKETIWNKASAVCYAACFRFYVGALGMDFSTGLIQFMMELIPIAIALWLLTLRTK